MALTCEEINKRLRSCGCGGRVKLVSLGYGYDTFDIKCERCGGIWHMDTYSPVEAAEMWGVAERSFQNDEGIEYAERH